MYDEFDNKENEDRYDPDAAPDTTASEPEQASDQYMQSEVTENPELTGDMEDTRSQQEQQQQASSVYHYRYEKGEQSEQTGSQQSYQQQQQQSYQQDPNRSYRQYYQNGEYHQRETGWHDGVYQNRDPYEEHIPESKGKKPLSDAKKIAIGLGCAVAFGVAVGLVILSAGTFRDNRNRQITAALEETSEQQTEQRAELQTQAAGDADNSQSAAQGAAVVGDVSAIAENAMPSIVAITNKGVEEVQSMFFGTTQYQETESAGSGVIIAKTDKELLIATNNHVVDGAEELSVCFTVDTDNKDDAVVKAQVKGTDSDHDLAVVAVNLSDISSDVQSKLKVAVMGDSDALKIGNQVIAIGNALGYGQSLTVGYVSALNREVTIDNVSNNMIQTDAAINFGNSGGALLDINGNLIGINSAKAADTGVEGMGYAIPINTASPILDELMNLSLIHI